MMDSPEQAAIYEMLSRQVIKAGLCTHCGTCVGLSDGTLIFRRGERGPLPERVPGRDLDLDMRVYETCPGKGLNYPQLSEFVFGRPTDDFLAGQVRSAHIGYSTDPTIRSQGASAGVITQTLSHLLEQGIVDGAVVLRHASPTPYLSTPVIARTTEEIVAAAQSVYVPTPVNTILAEVSDFEGRLAYVGLPDQVASLRALQRLGHPAALKIDFVLGPYVGTAMYLEAIESYLHSNGISGLEEIEELRYREGRWPGNLYIRTRSGRELRASKFYYNYLIPFYITRSTLFSVDFTNELTDLSVGDAWHPRYESIGQGFSVVLARTPKAQGVLEEMQKSAAVELESIDLADALAMHGHMLDFKKRGAFVRMRWRKAAGKNVPDYGYRPAEIPLTRYAVELVVSGLFAVGRTRPARWAVGHIPLAVIGPLFDILRKAWKNISRTTKRRGLDNMTFVPTDGVEHAKEKT